MFWLSLLSASAGNVYINGVRVEPSDLSHIELKSVNVKMTPGGDVVIDAPGYSVQPIGGGPPAPVMPVPPSPMPPVPMPTTPVPMPTTPVPMPPSAMPVPGPVPTQPLATETMATPPAPNSAMAPPATWWLYVEDQGSTGHNIDIFVNGQLVKSVRSGDSAIMDIGKWLRIGSNSIDCRAMSTAPTGGPLYVYIGRGQDNQGTVQMGSPEIQFGVGQSRSGQTSRQFTIEVN